MTLSLVGGPVAAAQSGLFARGYRPHMKIGVLEDIMPGNDVQGYFLDSGTPFDMPLTKGKRSRALAGIGLEASFAGGSTAELSYEAEAGSDSVTHALMDTLKLDW